MVALFLQTIRTAVIKLCAFDIHRTGLWGAPMPSDVIGRACGLDAGLWSHQEMHRHRGPRKFSAGSFLPEPLTFPASPAHTHHLPSELFVGISQSHSFLLQNLRLHSFLWLQDAALYTSPPKPLDPFNTSYLSSILWATWGQWLLQSSLPCPQPDMVQDNSSITVCCMKDRY